MVSIARYVGFPMAEITPVVRAGIALLFVFALITSVMAGGAVGAIALAAISIAVLLLTWRAASIEAEGFVVSIVAVALLLRALVAGILDVVLTARGHAGALFLDDAGYLQLASQVAESWHAGGPPIALDPSVGNTYVKLAAVLFFLVGPSPIVLKLVNAAFGVMAAVMVYRTMVNLRLPGPRIALVLILFFPSLVLWSALALKDAYALFFAVAPIWLMSEYARTRTLMPWYLLVVGSLLAIRDVRAYLFVILVAAWPIGTRLMVGGRGWLKPTAVAAALAVPLLTTTPLVGYMTPSLLARSEYIRQAMAAGARSGYVDPLPVARGNPGDRFVITAAGRTPVPIDQRREIPVVPGGHLVLEGTRPGPPTLPTPTTAPTLPTPTTAPTLPTQTTVRPGDIIVITSPTQTSAPTAASVPTPSPASVKVAAVGRNVVGTPVPVPAPNGSVASPEAPNAALGALTHLPIGVAYVVGAPFPMNATSLADVATIPEMLLWYVCEIFAVWGIVVLVRQRRFEFAYGVLVLGSMGLVLSLFEGNTGTLIRHRGIVIPFVSVLAAVGVAEVLKRMDRIALARTLVGR